MKSKLLRTSQFAYLSALTLSIAANSSVANTGKSDEIELLKRFEGTFILEKAGSEEVSTCILPELPSGSATTSFNTESVYGTKCSLEEQNNWPNNCWTDRAADLVLQFKVVGDQLVMSGRMMTENPEYRHHFKGQFELGKTKKIDTTRRSVITNEKSNGFTVKDHTSTQLITNFLGAIPVFEIRKAFNLAWTFKVKDSNSITITTDTLRDKELDASKTSCNLIRTNSIPESAFEN